MLGQAIILGLSIVSMAIVLYAAYWAFRIGRALHVGVYRGQAFGIGMVSLAIFVIFFLLGPLEAILSSIPSIVFLIPSLWASALVLLYWADSSARAGRRTDPLLRDPLRWATVRRAMWAYEVVVIGLGAVLYLLALLGLGGYASPYFRTSLGGALGLFSLFGPLLGTGVVGTVLLVTVAVRSQDAAMRSHLRWFSGFFFFLVAGLVASVALGSALGIDGGYAFAPASLAFTYCLYRGAKSLAPLNRLSREAPVLPGTGRSLRIGPAVRASG